MAEKITLEHLSKRLDDLEHEIEDVRDTAEYAADDARYDLQNLEKRVNGPSTVMDTLTEILDRLRYLEQRMDRWDRRAS